MDTESFRVVARFKAQPGRQHELRAVLVGLIEPTRRESGCIRYELLANQGDPTELTFVEEWEDPAALEAHFASAHIQAARERLPELLDEEMDLRRYDLVG